MHKGVGALEFYRIGDKTISRQQIDQWISRILTLRSNGLSQLDVASKLKVDRTFISRLETLGELRKGRSVAVLAFPVANGAQLAQICRTYGVDWWMFLSEEERLKFVQEKTGLQLFNEIMDILATIRSFETVVFMGSNKRVQIMEALLDKDVVAMEIGESPLTKDIVFDEDEFRQLISSLCTGKGGGEK